MSDLFRRLVAALPQRHVPTRASFATEPKALGNWLDHLPLANPTATARLLMNALREMNQLRLDPNQRITALEMMRSPAAQIVTALEKQTLADSFPLPPQKQQWGQLALDYEYELAIGYISALYDLCAPVGAVPFMRGKAVANALTRAIQHLGARLYKAYLLYQAPPEGTWQTLHDLFCFGVAVRHDEKTVDDPLLGGLQINARTAYMHALLFALCNPYRFTQKENQDIYPLARLCATQCELRPGAAPLRAVAVRMDSDLSPGYIFEEREQPIEGLWAFELGGLNRFLDSQLAMLPPGANVVTFRSKSARSLQADVGLVERLMTVWGGSVERAHPRLAANHQLDCVIGMHAAHYVLCNNMDFETFLRSIRGSGINLYENDQVASWASNANEQARVSARAVRVLDQSLGGYRILWEKPEQMRVRVGELVALSLTTIEEGEAREWMIGSIRWMRFEASGAIEAGIVLLSRRAKPVGVRNQDRAGMPGPVMRGIMLDSLVSDAAQAAPHRILVPHLFDRSTAEIELTRSVDPLAWPPEVSVSTIGGVRVFDQGGGYLQIALDRPAVDTNDVTVGDVPAANDDHLANGGHLSLIEPAV